MLTFTTAQLEHRALVAAFRRDDGRAAVGDGRPGLYRLAVSAIEERNRLRSWCWQMVEGLRHALELIEPWENDDADPRTLRHHLLGTLTDEENGRPIPALLEEGTHERHEG